MAILEREQIDRRHPHHPLRPAHAGHHRRPVPARSAWLRWPDIVRIILSGYTDAEDIITGVNEAGIWQYLLKPWQPEQLLLTLQRAAEVWRLQQENQRLSLDLRTAEPVLEKRSVESQAGKGQEHAFGLAGRDPRPGQPDQRRLRHGRHASRPSTCRCMVTGESGTGKEMIARAIHYESRRASKAFITENCGALPDTLLESELFGYKRGAFTGAVEDRVGLFQQADGGTLFLDEIGETSPAFQVKLLRVLQEGEFRPLGSNRSLSMSMCRVIAATNRDLEDDVRTGRFREDLYYRLATIALHVPPLARPSRWDLPLLARRLLETSSTGLGKPSSGFSPEAQAAMAAYRWPGNVRELQNEILRMLALADTPKLGADLLSPRVKQLPASKGLEKELAWLGSLSGGLKERMEQLEVQVLKEAMLRHRGNKSRAAKELGLSRVGLRSKLNRYGLEPA
jgi:two-component system response regulator HupR/HoxA